MAETATVQCANPACKVKTDGRCVEGLEKDKCPHYGKPLAVSGSVEPAQAERHGIILPSGDLLGQEEASQLLRRGNARIIAVVAPKDAGKTTLMRILTGLLVPNAGHVTLAGYDVVKDNDAILVLMVALEHYQGLYSAMPERIEDAAKTAVTEAKEAAERVAATAAELAHSDLVEQLACVFLFERLLGRDGARPPFLAFRRRLHELIAGADGKIFVLIHDATVGIAVV